MTEQWISVSPVLLREAFPDGDEDIDVPRPLLEALVAFLSEDLACDHSVGICMCGLVGVVTEMNLALQGKRSCRECGGDGTAWDQARADAWREANPGWDDWAAGMIDCPGCHGTGTVSA